MECTDHSSRQSFWVLQVGINNSELCLSLVDKNLEQRLIFESNGSSFDIWAFNPFWPCRMNIGRLNIGRLNIGRLNISLAATQHLNIRLIYIQVVVI